MSEDQPIPEPQPDTPEGRDRKVTVRPKRRYFGGIRRDRMKTAALESIAADLRRIADKYIGTTGEAPVSDLKDAEAAPFPFTARLPHTFRKVEGNRFCGECGGGRLHPIHTPEVKHNA